MEKKPKLLISGGGTGGHIYPAISIAEEFFKRYPHGAVDYIGKQNGREQTIVAQSGLPICYHGIHAQGIPRRISPAIFTALYQNILGCQEASEIINTVKPDVAVGTGGYVSAMAIKTAQKKGIPTLIHEQNAIPGITNRILGRKANWIASSYRESDAWFPKDKIRLTGNPVRKNILNLSRTEGLRAFGLLENLPTLLVFGGSQGALTINRATIEALHIIEGRQIGLQVILQTGEKGFNETQALMMRYAWNRVKIIVRPYLDPISLAYSVADVVIARAGAISISEITCCGLPSILIPYPYATANHQEKNARAVEAQKAALVVLESELTGVFLAEQIIKLIQDKELRKKMCLASKNLAKPDAAEAICDLIDSLIYQEKNER
jgi:UDP-N-acetylglucosamine--N-acetylmuramyl-(pentapeptide) pyrophosphoryl-undecaprenol N-acetylglucosamine transferase